MKTLILTLALFISTQAFSLEICTYQTTWELGSALEEAGIKPVGISRNLRRFSFVEKEMVHATVTLQDWLKGATRGDALKVFADLFQGGRGDLAGEIVYYTINNKTYAVVHYWPGENEYGAVMEMRGRAYRLIAQISDGDIFCRE